MANLNVFARDANGTPLADQLVTLTTAPSNNWLDFGIPIFPNPRRTSGDGGVNFYHGGPTRTPISIQASCQNGTSDPVVFDGHSDVTINLVVIPFD